MKSDLIIYTDGASRGNPGPGGWAAILMTEQTVVELSGAQDPATNNQMELMGVIEGLAYAKIHFPEHTVHLHADSTYVLKGIESWLDGWVRKDWMTTAKKPVENRALWEQLLELRNFFASRLKLVKVTGHSGEIYNERCDELAVAAALLAPVAPFMGSSESYKTYLNEIMEMKPKKAKKSSGAPYSYVSCVDGIVHADKTWDACQKRVNGKKGAKFKKVFSKEEETDVMQDYTLASLL